MNKAKSLVGSLLRLPYLRNAGTRRILLGVIVAVCAVLSLFPQKYRAAMSLTPTDPGSLGLAGAVGQLGALNSVFGNQSAIEISIKIAGSPYVANSVSKQLNLPKRLGKGEIEAVRWLDDEVYVRSLRGGIILFEMKDKDAQLAKDIVNAYGNAVREQLAVIGRNQTAYKRQILEELVAQSSDRLSRAQAAYDTFRLETRYSAPQAAIMALGERVPELEGLIRAKQVELSAARQFGTDDNNNVRQILAEIAALNRQLDQVRSTSPVEHSSVGRVVSQSTQEDKLHRELEMSRSLYDNYKRYLQGTSVEDLTSTATVRVLEPAFIDPERQYNFIPLAIGLISLLLGLAFEFYLLRPPVGDRNAA